MASHSSALWRSCRDVSPDLIGPSHGRSAQTDSSRLTAGLRRLRCDAPCRKLAASSATGGATERERRRAAVYEACVTALESLVEEGVFGTAGIRVVVFAISDVEDPVREVEWIRRLNPPSRSRDVWEDAVASRS
ncbi:DUF4303 domain-containing protein [Streptomyces tirandamycinicus]|uniref:DUF4303 domain-containing protein n=1 Tax=Streptomyces tirandamycinicus TaxID=2174846 RepID=UPI00342B4CD6